MSATSGSELESIKLFAGLDADERAIIADLLTIETYGNGLSIVREGEVGYVFYVLKTGRAEVSHEGPLLRVLAPGDFFGEVAISGDGKRSSTVTARGDVEIWAMFGTSLGQLERSHPDIASKLRTTVRDRQATD
ncbi:MAG: cyclic nucleotide-binding domain-containing protein [Actinomycetia bacterium]|nr:cyclic nucleotide-binding domain-containing protein [Actinomycetes bacterium]